jgi:hypothetical protein
MSEQHAETIFPHMRPHASTLYIRCGYHYVCYADSRFPEHVFMDPVS